MIQGALDRKVPVVGFAITQTFLVLTTIYILIPSLMVVATLLMPAQLNRRLNIIVSLVYVLTIIGAIVGEPWKYFILGSIVEILLLLGLVRIAWTWPRNENQLVAP